MHSQTRNPLHDSEILEKIDTELKKYNAELNRAIDAYNQKIAEAQEKINAAFAELRTNDIHRPVHALPKLSSIQLEKLDKTALRQFVANPDSVADEKAPNSIHPILNILLKHPQQKEIWLAFIEKYPFLDLETPSAENALSENEHESRTWYRKVFDVGKKLVDLLDDVWAIVRNTFSADRATAYEFLSAILIGACGFIIHLCEGIIALNELDEILTSKDKKQFKTKMISNVAAIFIAFTGFGMSLMLLAHGISAAVGTGILQLTVYSIFTVLVPGLLAGIYGLALWRKGYILHQINHEKESVLTQAENDHEESIKEFRKSILQYKKTISELLEQLKHPSNPEQMGVGILKTSETIKAEIAETTEHLFAVYEQLHHFEVDADRLITEKCQAINNKARAAERDVGFTTFEVIGSILVAVGILLGTTSLIGGTGGVALPIIVVGVAVGFLTKLLEVIDEKLNFRFTNWARGILFNILRIDTTPRHHTYERILDIAPELTEKQESKTTPPHSPRTPIDLNPPDTAPVSITFQPAAPVLTTVTNTLDAKSDAITVVQPSSNSTSTVSSVATAPSDHGMMDRLTQTHLHLHDHHPTGTAQEPEKKTDNPKDSSPEPQLNLSLSPSVASSQ